MESSNQPLSNLQLEILKAFSYKLNIKDLQDFKDYIARYFANKAVKAADKAWEEKGWDEEDVDRMLETKMRISSKTS